MTQQQKTALVWFRQDLRLADNPALHYATQHYDRILALYIYDDVNLRALGGASRWWLHHSLNSLQQDLTSREQTLVLRHGDAKAILAGILAKQDIDAVFWNRCYEPDAISRDKTIKQYLESIAVEAKSFNASLLAEPWEIKNKSGGFFKVFTPFWKSLSGHLHTRALFPMPTFQQPGLQIESDTLTAWGLLPSKPNWAVDFPWQVGEQAALQRLEDFLSQDLKHYKDFRDRADLALTSKLSAHLHFGEIGPWQIWHATNKATGKKFLDELGWREFSYHLLYHVPTLAEQNFKDKFDQFPWQHNDAHLKAWQQGLTGYPIVDAGMRELWATGIMHNRVRMIVASFLIKDLLIDWRHGEAWFWDTLVDADFANNAASWQWVAGSGADAAPYFRVFNPVLQGQKFDPEGKYVKKWLPELAAVPAKFVHEPWLSPDAVADYPVPIVDHKAARERALAIFSSLS